MTDHRTDKPHLLILSHVLPFPGTSGQQQRVLNTLKGLRPLFHLCFVTPAQPGKEIETETKLRELCDEVILLPSLYNAPGLGKFIHRLRAALFCARTGLKSSNYAIGDVEFSPSRLAHLLDEQKRQGHTFDAALYEYWHAENSVPVLQARGIPCALDMHDILWQAYARQLEAQRAPGWWKARNLRLYQRAEEAAWKRWDLLISINDAEHDYARQRVPQSIPFINAYMGVDTDLWPYVWQPSTPPRVLYYGGLGSPHNARESIRCAHEIMPRIWQKYPHAEYWIVGSKPPPAVQALAEDKRVHVTGFVQDAAEILKTMTVMLCPWTGKYGFRSRLMEAMSLGVPVIASSDAVYGMGMKVGDGLFLEETAEGMANTALCLLDDAELAAQQSRRARAQVESKYSFDATYGQLARELRAWVESKK
jgi:polysaccharide biosynthesis protein PslH